MNGPAAAPAGGQPDGRRWAVDVNRLSCMGSGMCVGSAPDFFQLTRGRAELLSQQGIAPDDAVLDAAESCPAEAITIRDAADGSLIAPEE